MFPRIDHYFHHDVTVVLISLLLPFVLTSAQQEPKTPLEYTNEFAVHLDSSGPNCDSVADQIARRSGFVNKGKIGSLDGHYLFEHHVLERRSLDYAHHYHKQLKEDPRVVWVEQQHVKKRKKRDGLPDDLRRIVTDSSVPVPSAASSMPDPLYPEQWYLNHGARGGYDMNVAAAWALGYTGKKVVVTILDDGIQPDHPDLEINYDPLASFDINDNDPDPTPQDNGDNKHGTRCAGEVSAQAFNQFCGVGVAYNSSIGGVRMLDGTVTDQVEARALSLNPDHVDIYSASWGPEDDGKTVDGPGRLAKRAFVDGIRKGRRGLGSIFIWASGNGGRKQDNCNCDGYTNSIYTLSISSATQAGAKPWYLEECSSTLATTYSSGSPGSDQNVVTVDMDTTYGRSIREGSTPVTSYLCTLSHTGTSASAPIAAGIAALALEANPRLTWRDMQHLVVATSRYEPLRWESGWGTNGIGRKYSHKFGYGLMDAEAMVKLAERWHPSPPQRVCDSPANTNSFTVPSDGRPLEVSMTVNGCQRENNEIHYLEHVQTRISLKFKPRGNVKITLTSPSGTASHLLLPRVRDSEDDTFNEWPFLSVHFWGENPGGTWKLRIHNTNTAKVASWPGTLMSWAMTFYGTYERPQSMEYFTTNKSSIAAAFRYLPRRTNQNAQTRSLMTNECTKSGLYQSPTGTCVSKCGQGFYGDSETSSCKKCQESCSSCYGPTVDNCLSCTPGRWFYGDRCLRVCPDTHYADEKLRECLPCSSNCASCSGSPIICKSCPGRQQLDSNFKCVNPEYASAKPCSSSSSQSNGPCCHNSCETCSGPELNKCLSCPTGRKLMINRCISEACPLGFYEQIDHSGRSECKKCHHHCRTCSGPSHTQCIDCKESLLLKDSLCTPCPHGHFLNRAQEVPTCSACHHSCSECSGPSQEDCLNCEPGLNLLGGRCIPCCPTNSTSPTGEQQDCCPCIHQLGPCKNVEHTRSVYGANDELVADKWSKQVLTNLSRTVITTVALLILLSLFILFVIINITPTSRLSPRLRFLSMRYGGQALAKSQFIRMRTSQSSSTSRTGNEYERVALTDEDDINGDDENYLFEKT